MLYSILDTPEVSLSISAWKAGAIEEGFPEEVPCELGLRE